MSGLEEYGQSTTIPPTYAPPGPPPDGKPLSNWQKVALAATISVTILIVVLLGLFLQHRI